MCSCTKSIEHRHRLFACSREVTEDLEMFAIRESTHYCIHAIIAQKLSSQDFSATEVPEHSEEDIESSVDLLSTSPFLAAVYCTTSDWYLEQKLAGAQHSRVTTVAIQVVIMLLP